MNIQGGGLSFEISGQNEKLMNVLKQTQQAIQGFASSAAKSGKGVDAAFSTSVAVIQKLRADLDKADIAWTQTMDRLQAKLAEVKAARQQAWETGNDKAFGKATQEVQALEAQVRAQQRLGEEIKKTFAELDAEEASLRRQHEQTEANANAQASLRTQLRTAVEQLAQMEAEGKRGTEEFRRMQEEAGRLQDAIGDARQQARLLSHDNAGLQGFISGVSGLTGAFTAAQGAMALFGDENEDLQKAMLKVQSVMSISMGLQQVFNTLNKDSAFMLSIVAKAKDALTAANARLAAALGVSTAAAQALMATLTLGLSVAITAVIALIAKMQSKAAEAKKAQDEFNKKVAEAAGKPLEAYMELRAEWFSLTDSLQEREKFVKDNVSRFEELGWSVKDAKDAENLLVNNTGKVIEAFILRAKAMAAQQIAAEKYKDIVEETLKLDGIQQYEYTTGLFKNEKTGKVEYGVHKEIRQEWAEQNSKITKMQAEVAKYTDLQVQLTAQEKAIIASLGVGTKEIVEGSYAAAEQEVQRLRTLYNRAATDAERASIAIQLRTAEANAERLKYKNSKGGNGGNTTTTNNDKDAYAEMLAQRKALYSKYSKWVQSEDETVRNAANTEFAALLQEGSSYLDYLKNQRDAISAKAKKTATDLKNLQTLNNEIAEATKHTVLSEFETQLNKDLAECKTISEMLAVIERSRSELSGDNSDVDNGKADILKGVEAHTKQKAKEETAALLQEYAAYLNEKVQFEEAYARKKELLTKAAAEATTGQEKQVAEAALAALEAKRKEYAKRSGSEAYDNLLQQYQTYQQQQTSILEKYETQRAEAVKMGNTQLMAQIDEAQRAELSKLATTRLMASAEWGQLFTDLTMLSTETINKLLADVNDKKVTLSAQFSPTDLAAINAQLQKAKDEIHERNPFLALRDALTELRAAMKADKLLSSDDPFVKSLQDKKKQYQEYTDAVNSSDEKLAGSAKDAYADLLSQGSTYIDFLRRKIAELNKRKVTIGLDVQGEEQLAVLEAAFKKEVGESKSVGAALKETFSSVSGSIDFVKGSFNSVIGGMKKMGVTMDEETEVVLNDIGEMMDGASQLAKGIATSNPLSIIQGSVSFLSAAFDLFNSRDRKAERAIKEHEKAVKRLGYAYTALQHAVDKALGETVYQNRSALIQNLRQQQNELNGMIEAEKGKKRTNWDRIEEWQEKIAETARQIEDIMDDIAADITQTTARDLSNQLADALVEAFQEGSSAAEVFGEVANDVLRNAVKNALMLQFLEKPLQSAIRQLQRDMGFDAEGNGTFDGLTQAEQDRFKNAVAKAGQGFQEAMKMYEDLFTDVADPSTLSGALKGASQESIDLLAGTMNAVRVNQATALGLFREQLLHLSNMDANIGVIAGRLLTIINRLYTPADDGLRGQGITD